MTSQYKDWVLKHCGQTILVASQINFNKRIVSCLSKSDFIQNLENYKSDLITSINKVASLIVQDLPVFKLMSIEALLTLDVHSRDILTALIQNKVS